MYKDITNIRSGRLVAIERTDKKDKMGGCYLWRCKCDCGNYVDVSICDFMRGSKKSCGCMHKDQSIETLDIANQKLGRLDGTCLSSISKKTISKNNTSGIRGVTWNRDKKSGKRESLLNKNFIFLARLKTLKMLRKQEKKQKKNILKNS